MTARPALCDPDWTETPDHTRTLARIELQQLAEPANPTYRRARAGRRVRDIQLTGEYL
ncbi:hypothetical protein [Streptomyces sp. NPDC093223]|uniref:hypothetical protein n=1 Tax=Streptomyces sp. NPDC093223 TaxID=3366033 RepID=UPI0037FC4C0D